MMEAIVLAVASVTMVILLSTTICWGLWLHHQREAYQLRIRENEVNQMFLLSEKALDMKILPPAFNENIRRISTSMK